MDPLLGHDRPLVRLLLCSRSTSYWPLSLGKEDGGRVGESVATTAWLVATASSCFSHGRFILMKDPRRISQFWLPVDSKTPSFAIAHG